MRIAAMILGLLGGVLGLFVGFLGYAGGAVLALLNPDATGMFDWIVQLWLGAPRLMQIVSIAVPVMTLIGGGLALRRPVPAAILMLIGALGFFLVFGLGSLALTFRTFVVVPFLLSLIGGVLAFFGREPAPPAVPAA
ncbi:MAG TPA: hypothetical protein VFB16_08625 [Bauldia sp.]|nr:hypothetical protein [Bauldia sp.]